MTRLTTLSIFALVVVLFAQPGPAEAQTLQQRIEQVRQQRQADAAAQARRNAAAADEAAVSTRVALQAPLPEVELNDIAARDALTWLSNVSGLKIVVNWRQLESVGIDPESPVNLSMRGLTAQRALSLILEQVSFDMPLLAEATPWYVRIMTKDEANANPVVRVYLIGDLLHRVPNFEKAPEFDLNQITQATSGGGAQSGSLFSETDQDEEDQMSPREMAEQIAQVIRDSIEPDIWRENGGLYGSITIWRDALVVRAPLYVHRRIGIPTVGLGSTDEGGVLGMARQFGPPSPFAGDAPYAGPVDAFVERTGRYVTINARLDHASVRSPIRQIPVISRNGLAPRSAVPDAGIAPR